MIEGYEVGGDRLDWEMDLPIGWTQIADLLGIDPPEGLLLPLTSDQVIALRRVVDTNSPPDVDLFLVEVAN